MRCPNKAFCSSGGAAAKAAAVSGPLRVKPAGSCSGFHAMASRLHSRRPLVLAAGFRCRLRP
eukprot:5019845-Heterocapsa_arctica.AAC.1